VALTIRAICNFMLSTNTTPSVSVSLFGKPSMRVTATSWVSAASLMDAHMHAHAVIAPMSAAMRSTNPGSDASWSIACPTADSALLKEAHAARSYVEGNCEVGLLKGDARRTATPAMAALAGPSPNVEGAHMLPGM
jgi:hypothetical protein